MRYPDFRMTRHVGANVYSCSENRLEETLKDLEEADIKVISIQAVSNEFDGKIIRVFYLTVDWEEKVDLTTLPCKYTYRKRGSTNKVEQGTFDHEGAIYQYDILTVEGEPFEVLHVWHDIPEKVRVLVLSRIDVNKG